MNFFDSLEQQERAEIYRLFGLLFLNIPEVETIEEFEKFIGISISDSYEDICDDFISLFHEGKVPNYEGYYRELLYREIPIELDLLHVQHFYWAAGVAIEEEFDLPPDHVSMELIFMSYIVEQNLIELQIEFLKRLREWIPLFCDNLYEKAKTDFYKEVATSLKDFVLSESEGIV